MQIKNVNDYVDSVHEKFPELTRDEVKRILVYGWKQIVQYVSAGNAVRLGNGEDFVFFGKWNPKDKLDSFKYYCRKLSKRIAYMFQRTKAQWDGYYYFSRSERQYQDYLSQKRKKKKVFKDVFLAKILEEIRVRDYANPYIFRLNEDRTSWRHKYYPEICTDKAELIEIRDPLNMRDVMTSQNKFKYLQ